MPPQTPPPVGPTPAPPHTGAPFAAVLITLLAVFALIGVAWKMGFLTTPILEIPEPQSQMPSALQTEYTGDAERIIRELKEISETGRSSVSVATEQSAEVSTGLANLKEGVYALEGHGASGGKYGGTVTIIKRQGTPNVYDLEWNIGSGEVQYGVGVLQEDILSVGYYETRDGAVIEAGAVGFVVIDEAYLTGQWVSARGGGVGVEDLVWRSAQ